MQRQSKSFENEGFFSKIVSKQKKRWTGKISRIKIGTYHRKCKRGGVRYGQFLDPSGRDIAFDDPFDSVCVSDMDQHKL
jgi:hypothetical protein